MTSDDSARIMAALLQRHRETIVARWSERIEAELPHRKCKPTASNIAGETRGGIDALIDFHQNDDITALDDHVDRVVRTRLGKCTDCWEFLDDLLLLKTAALPCLLKAEEPAPIGARECVTLLDIGMNRMIARFCDAFGRELRAHEMSQAVSGERNRLARELHDSVTQSIHGVTLFAQATERLLQAGRTEEALARVRQIEALGSEALRELRLSLFELHPPVLEHFGLARALRGRLDSVEGRSGLRTSFEVLGEESPPLDVQEGLLRIGLELLNNTLKHARASSIEVRLVQSPELAELAVTDDGAGFDPRHRDGGLGIRLMEERARELGATLSIRSAPGQGTRARIVVPLTSDARPVTAGGEESIGIRDDPHPAGR